MEKIYTQEFLGTLIAQAVDKKDRYKPLTHKHIKEGDIVLIKELNCKPNNFCMGRIRKVIVNDLGEVTNAVVMKGKTRELLKRHASTLIPILEVKETMTETPKDLQQAFKNTRPKRSAAESCRQKIKSLADANLS